MDEQAALVALARRHEHMAQIDQLITQLAGQVECAVSDMAEFNREAAGPSFALKNLPLTLRRTDELRQLVGELVLAAIKMPPALSRMRIAAGATLADVSSNDRVIVDLALEQYKERTGANR